MMNQVSFHLHRHPRRAISQLRRFGLAVMPLLMQRAGLAASLGALPAMAYAQTVTGGASPQTMINNVCTFILGPFGQTLAVLGIIAIGVLFMFGRASLGIIAGIIGGIVIMFGASYLGETLTGG
jgi:type IV secretion system protein VirB2